MVEIAYAHNFRATPVLIVDLKHIAGYSLPIIVRLKWTRSSLVRIAIKKPTSAFEILHCESVVGSVVIVPLRRKIEKLSQLWIEFQCHHNQIEGALLQMLSSMQRFAMLVLHCRYTISAAF